MTETATQQRKARLHWPLAFFTLIILVGSAIYSQALFGPFVYDDYGNLLANPEIRHAELKQDSLWAAMTSGEAGPLTRPLSMLSFAINFATTGEDVRYLKGTNLVIHLLNGLLLAWLGYLALQIRRPAQTQRNAWLAVIAASVWMLHPLNLTPVLYVVQRMTSLSTLFTLVALITYLHFRTKLDTDQHKKTVALGILFLVSLLCATLAKESGMLTIVYVLVLEWIWLAPLENRMLERLRRISLPLGALAIGAILLFILHMRGGLEQAYAVRNFTLEERLLTQGRVLWWYLGQLFWPDIRELGLVHDDWTISTTLTIPSSTAIAAAAWLAVVGLAVRMRQSWPLFAFAAAWYLGGHVLESSILPLELVFEHRNYLPTWGIVLASTVGLTALFDRLAFSRGARLAVTAASLAALSFILHFRVQHWDTLQGWAEAQVHHHPNSPSNHYFLASVHSTIVEESTDPSAELNYRLARHHYLRAQSLNPGAIYPLVSLAILDSRMGATPAPELFEDIAENVGQGVVHTTDFNALIDIFQCMVKGTCALPREAVRKIANAALGNNSLHPKWRHALRNNIASYWLHVEKDLDRAENLARAAAYEPSFNFEGAVVLVQALAAKSDWEGSLAVLEDITDRDPIRQHQKTVAELRQQVQQARTQEQRDASAEN